MYQKSGIKGAYIEDVSTYTGNGSAKSTYAESNCDKDIYTKKAFIKAFYGKVIYIGDASIGNSYS